jgi:hypothetical protein
VLDFVNPVGAGRRRSAGDGRRNEGSPPALFYVNCLLTIGAWAASDWPAGVIHHLGWPQSCKTAGSCLVPASPAVPAATENDNHDDQNDEKCGVVHLVLPNKDGQLT